jgi:D-glycero-D-manno-heptose 1,7-bisphosphate phosphatase
VSRRCVFLDRDGVINVKALEGEYIQNWSEFQFLPNIADWIRLFNALDFLVIVVTNQRGVALGRMSLDDVAGIHRRMIRELADQGAKIDDVFVCPHEAGVCQCRKPKPGLVEQARDKWDIEVAASLMIGDSDSDEQLAAACGMRFLRARDGRLVCCGQQQLG